MAWARRRHFVELYGLGIVGRMVGGHRVVLISAARAIIHQTGLTRSNGTTAAVPRGADLCYTGLMGGIEFIEPEEAEAASHPGRPEPVGRGWATPAITTPNIAISSSILIAAVIAGSSSFFNVYRSSLTIMAGDAPTGYKYSVDGWGGEDFQFFNFGGSGKLATGTNPRFGIILVAVAVLLLIACVLSAVSRQSWRSAGRLLTMMCSGALLASGGAMILSMQAAGTLGGPEVEVTTALGPCAWLAAVAGLLPLATYATERLRRIRSSSQSERDAT